MTDYRTPQAEVHVGDLAPDPVMHVYHAYCLVCARDVTPPTRTGRPTRDYLTARRWLKAHGWSDYDGPWRCPQHALPEATP